MSVENSKKSAMSIPVIFEKKEEFTCDDGRFTKVKIWLMHLGENFNGCIFEKEIVDAALATLEYIPIVGFIESNSVGDNDFSDHRYIITKDENGVHKKYVGSAYGVVLSSADNNAHYEERMCDDGVTRTFLVVEGVIWNMFEDSSEILNRDLIKSHSMELFQDVENVYEGYEDDDGIYHFTKFSFRAACILGNNYEPAMINSTIEVQFTMTDFVKKLQNELNDKFTTFTKMIDKNFKKGSVNMSKTNYAQTVMEQFSDISAIVSKHEIIEDRWGDAVSRYRLCDIQDNEIIVVDKKNDYHFYGFTFTIEGDKPIIDFTNGKRKKTRYEDYVEGESTNEGYFDFGKHIAEIEEVAFTKVNEANTKATNAENAKTTAETNYSKIKADYDEIKPKYDNYVMEEQARIDAEVETKKDNEFAKYEKALSGVTEFEALKEKKADMTVEDIEKECAVLYARKNLDQTNFSKSGATPAKVGVIDDESGTDGFIETKYGYIQVNR